MAENEAINVVAKSLASGTDLSAFKPEDVKEDFFVGGAFIAAAAAIFLAAFAKGINTALEKKGQEIGESVGNWFISKLENLFRKPETAKKEEEQATEYIKEVTRSRSKLDAKTRNTILDATEDILVQKMEERGIPRKKAVSIAKSTRTEVEALLPRDLYGPKQW